MLVGERCGRLSGVSEGPYRSSAEQRRTASAGSRWVVPAQGPSLVAVAWIALVGTCASVPAESTLSCVRDAHELSCVLQTYGPFSTKTDRVDADSIDVIPAKKGAMRGRNFERVAQRWRLVADASGDKRAAQPPRASECWLEPTRAEWSAFLRERRGRAVLWTAESIPRHNPAALLSICVVGMLLYGIFRTLADVRRVTVDGRTVRIRTLLSVEFEHTVSAGDRVSVEDGWLVIRGRQSNAVVARVISIDDEAVLASVKRAIESIDLPPQIEASRAWIFSLLVALFAATIALRGCDRADQRPTAEHVYAQVCADAQQRR